MTATLAAPEPGDSRFAYALWAIREAKASLVELAVEVDDDAGRDICLAIGCLQRAEAACLGANYWWRRSAA